MRLFSHACVVHVSAQCWEEMNIIDQSNRDVIVLAVYQAESAVGSGSQTSAWKVSY